MRPVITEGDVLTFRARKVIVMSVGNNDLIRCSWRQRRGFDNDSFFLEWPVESELPRQGLILENIRRYA